MTQRKELLLCLILVLFMFSAFARNNQRVANANDSIRSRMNQDETILFNMINDMRIQNKLQAIPYSPDLCKVANTHIADLIKYKPQEKGCSLHSWSGSGKWTSCCNTKEVFGIQCMKSKPREITGYKGDGFELIYWGEDKATPEEAAALWKQVDASLDMILSRAKWRGYQWKALGVGIKDGYAILWLGDSVNTGVYDNLPEYIPEVTKPAVKTTPVVKVPAVEKEVVKPTVTAKPTVTVKPAATVKTKESIVKDAVAKPAEKATGTIFYIIAGSFSTFEAANNELKNIKQKGYPNAYILKNEPLFRIVLTSFNTKEKADKVKNELKDNFPGVWVFRK